MVSPGGGGNRELKRNKDAGERIKLLPQTAWSDYFFFQNMQAYIWFLDLPEDVYKGRQVLKTQARDRLFK